MQPYSLLWLTLSNADAGTSTYLTDASGLQYQITEDVTYSSTYPTYSASGGFQEAYYVSAVTASTVSGGTTSQYPSDMFDGYGPLFVDSQLYFGNGLATSECGDRQLVFGTQTIGDLSVWRKIYVPEDDEFARMVVFVRNDSTTDISTTVGFKGDLGSDSNTTVMADSSGDGVVDLKDNWAVSMERFDGTTSNDPRIGHVWQSGTGILADEIKLDDGDDTFHWRFTVDIPAGHTVAIATFVTGQGTWAAAQAKAEELVLLPDTATECLTKEEWGQVVNFGVDCSHLDDQCNDGVYDPKTDACVATPANEAGACDDGLECTEKDVCGAGTCAGIETAEVTGDGIDEDCDVGEICFADADGDGHAADDGSTVVSKDDDCADAGEASNKVPADDCDDAHADAYPGGTEVANDGIDQDCDGKDLVKKTGGDDSGTADGGAGDDSGAGDNGDGSDTTNEDSGGCSCGTSRAPTPLSALVLLGMVGLVARRRRV
jgi:MYXO-CTERM domain-containing protein